MSAKELGKELQELRKAKEIEGRKVSLRDVEEATGVKNAYLSLLERGEIAQPSPQKLHTLAEYYGVPYERLMYAAGYLVEREKKGTGVEMPMPVEAYFMAAKLDQEEWKQLADFHDKFLRKKPSS